MGMQNQYASHHELSNYKDDQMLLIHNYCVVVNLVFNYNQAIGNRFLTDAFWINLYFSTYDSSTIFKFMIKVKPWQR